MWARKFRKRSEAGDKWWKDAAKATEAIRRRQPFRLAKPPGPDEGRGSPTAKCSRIQPRRAEEAPTVDASKPVRCRSKASSASGGRSSAKPSCSARRWFRPVFAECASGNRSRRGENWAQRERQPDMPAARRMVGESYVASRHPRSDPPWNDGRKQSLSFAVCTLSHCSITMIRPSGRSASQKWEKLQSGPPVNVAIPSLLTKCGLQRQVVRRG